MSSISNGIRLRAAALKRVGAFDDETAIIAALDSESTRPSPCRLVLEKRVGAVLQPDLAHCGGVTEGRKIAAMGETYYAQLAPHNPLGPVNLAASIQLALTLPSFLRQEQLHLGHGIVDQPFTIKDGYIEAPTAPGLGVSIDPDFLAASDFDGEWRLPQWHQRSGGRRPAALVGPRGARQTQTRSAERMSDRPRPESYGGTLQ